MANSIMRLTAEMDTRAQALERGEEVSPWERDASDDDEADASDDGDDDDEDEEDAGIFSQDR